MFGIGMPELLIIVAIALIVFGPNKLPELAKGFGRAMREFRKATEEVKESFEAETRDLKELEDLKHTVNEQTLTHLIEETSTATASAKPDASPTDASAPQGSPSSQEPSTTPAEQKPETESAHEHGGTGTKEGTPAGG